MTVFSLRRSMFDLGVRCFRTCTQNALGGTQNAPRLLSARVNLIASPGSGLRVLLLAFRALGFEFCELLRSEDRFRRLHVFGFARFVATRLLMLRHGRVHLRLLIRCQVEARQ